MSYDGWYSRQDVLKDLRKASGKLVRGLDKGSVLVGDQPPPQRHNLLDEDAELQLLRLCGGRAPCAADCVVKPDLPGITQMLRMVNGLTEEEEAEKNRSQKETLLKTDVLSISKINPNVKEFVNGLTEEEEAETKRSQNGSLLTTDVLSISKLNPNVKEFVPRACRISRVSPVKDCTSKTDVTSIKEINCKTDDIGDVTENPVEKAKPSEEEMKNKLMAMIKNTSKATCMTAKRERNLAIASLLKLHCGPQEMDEQKPKLISPAYFEKSNLAPNNKVQKVEVEKINAQSTNSDKIYPNVEIPKEKKEIIAETSVADIAASVDKVQKWLHDSENAATKTKTPEKVVKKVINSEEKSPETQKTLYLGKVTFKRKALSKPMSPTSTESSAYGVKTAKPSAYTPSEYANELARTYQERIKLKEEEEQEINKRKENGIWASAITQMEARDEQIRKRQAESNAQGDVTME